MVSQIEVRRSTRRRKTVTAFYEDGRAVVAIPARFTAEEEQQWVARMVQRLERKHRRPSDTELAARSAQLSAEFLGGRAVAQSVSWVSNQRSRWGSCTPATGTIRISDQLKGMPRWVVDYVLVHELAHLLVPRHGADFWALVESYPHTERARGFLSGVAYAGRMPVTDDDDDVDDAPAGQGVLTLDGVPADQ